MKVVSFGLNSSPFLLCAVIRKQAFLKLSEFEKEADSLDSGMYMDDLTAGGDTPEEAMCRSVNIKKILDEAKLPLVKWITSSKKVSKNLRENKFHMHEEYDENLPETKILGIHWDPNEDTITMREINLDVFCDASLKGYGCFIYVCTPKYGRKLLKAKSRVAPVGTLTLPKLELTAALLGVRLAKYVKKSLPVGYTVGEIRYFSDSQVALSWITSEKNTWKPYVTNRVHEILASSKRDQWYYVNTENNPADIATRIDKIKELIQGTVAEWSF
uniref:Uncharacterized protein n=1 Tax=Strigamia maritima TaxID=126957 RepID=T1IHX3_STRMM